MLRLVNLVFIFTSILCFAPADAQDSLDFRVWLEKADSLSMVDKIDEAISAAMKGYTLSQRIHGEASLEVAEALEFIGDFHLIAGEWEKAKPHYEQALAIRKQKLSSPHLLLAKSYFSLANYHQRLAEFEVAIAFYHQANDNIPKDTVTIEYADVMGGLGTIYLRQNRFDLASTHISACLDILERMGETYYPSLSTMLNNMGMLALKQSQYDKAYPYFMRSLEVAKEVYGDYHLQLSYIYNNIANIFHDRGVLDTAIVFYQKAVQCLEDSLHTHPDLPLALDNLAVALRDQGNMYTAEETLKRARQLYFHLYPEGHPALIDTYVAFGNLYLYKGDAEAAELQFKKALQLAFQKFGMEHIWVSTIYARLGKCYLNRKNFQQAASYFRKSIRILERMKMHRDKRMGSICSMLGRALDEGGTESDSAQYYLERGAEIAIYNFGKQHWHVASAYRSLAWLHYRENRKRKAEFYLSQIEEIFQANYNWKGSSYLAIAYHEQGNFLYQESRYQEALMRYELALEVLNFDEQQIKAGKMHHNPMQLLSVLGETAKTYMALFQNNRGAQYYEQASSYFQNATLLAEQMRNTYRSEEARQELTEKSFSIFENAIKNEYQAWQLDGDTAHLHRAFAFSEKSKTVNLMLSLHHQHAVAHAGVPDSLLNQEYDCKVRRSWLHKRRFEFLEKGEVRDSVLLHLEVQLYDVEEEEKALLSVFKRDYPAYYRLKYDQKICNVQQVQEKLLEEDQGMVEYFIGDSSSFVFFISRDEFQVQELPKGKEIRQLVRKFQEGIGSYFKAPQQTEENYIRHCRTYQEAAWQLYRLLLLPFEKLLPRQLIIVPDGAISKVAFEALLHKDIPPTYRFKSYPFLLKSYNISYTWSAGFYQWMLNREDQQLEKPLLAVAPIFTVNDGTLSDLADYRQDPASLFFNIAEANAVHRLFGGTLLAGAAANQEAFRRQASKCQIIHLATHAHANELQGEFSYLLFSKDDSLGGERLYANEIYQMFLPAEMVVLSTCESGSGEEQRGEGVISLARSFSCAGAASSVTSLWSVNDASTAELMQYFYENLRIGIPKAEALRQAKLRYLEERPHDEAHPWFWAAFIPMGNMRPVIPPSNDLWWMAASGLLLLLLLGWFILRPKNVS